MLGETSDKGGGGEMASGGLDRPTGFMFDTPRIGGGDSEKPQVGERPGQRLSAGILQITLPTWCSKAAYKSFWID